MGLLSHGAPPEMGPGAWPERRRPTWLRSRSGKRRAGPCGRRRATSVVQLHMPAASRLPCAGGLLFHGPFRQRADICPHSVRCGQIANSCKRRWPGAFPSRSGLPAMSRRQSNHGTSELSTRTGLRGRMSTGCMSNARSDCRATWAVAQAHPHRTTGGAQTTAAAQTRQRGMPRRDACERKPAAPKNDMPAVDPQAGAGLLRAPLRRIGDAGTPSIERDAYRSSM